MGTASPSYHFKLNKSYNMANGWSIIIGFVVVALACVAGWFLAPKGETQTYELLLG